MIKVCLVGLGKTGKEVAKAILEQNNIELVAAICSATSEKKGKDLGHIIQTSDTGVIIEDDSRIEEIVFRTKPDIVVDFSRPDVTIRNARVFSKMKVNLVIGTTGFSKFALNRLFLLTRKYNNGIVYAPNITLGVNVVMLLANLTSNILSNYDFQITEIHHKNKKDIPSGTALKISDEIKDGLKNSGFEADKVSIPINAVRAGGVVGKHEILVVGEDDRIVISHESFSRKVFAGGAIKAIDFIYGKKGYYEMGDVLNLNKAVLDYMEKQGRKFAQKNRKQMLV